MAAGFKGMDSTTISLTHVDDGIFEEVKLRLSRATFHLRLISVSFIFEPFLRPTCARKLKSERDLRITVRCKASSKSHNMSSAVPTATFSWGLLNERSGAASDLPQINLEAQARDLGHVYWRNMVGYWLSANA